MMNNLSKVNGVSCIYQFRNLIDDKRYIGSTNNLMYRKNLHLNHLRKGTHFNPKLQRAWNKYGEENFNLEILITCDQTMLFWYEQQFLDQWKPEYNISKYAKVPTKRGEHLQKAHKNKISNSLKGRKLSPEHREKTIENLKGRKFSDETRKLWSKQRVGHERTAKFHVGLVSPDGTIYENIFNMAKFCREHGLCKGAIGKVEKELQPHHKGWVLWKGIDVMKCEHNFIQNNKQGKRYCKTCGTPEMIITRGNNVDVG